METNGTSVASSILQVEDLRVYFKTLSGILKAVEGCPEDPLGHCVLCSNTKILHYGGQDIVSICVDHDKAWGKWLDEHPQWRAHLAPRGRSVKANWVELFREFIEDMRQKGQRP